MMSRTRVQIKCNLIVIIISAVVFPSCKDQGEETTSARVSTDADLFTLITRTQPFTSYRLFPNADSVTSGTLNGSTAHQPTVRVSMNATAFGGLQNGMLPVGGAFPDGSIIVKEIRTNGQTTLYAVLYKDRGNAMAETGSGWLWAEYFPDGRVAFSVTTRGSGCISCHSREQGPQHDFVRTFERQR